MWGSTYSSFKRPSGAGGIPPKGSDPSPLAAIAVIVAAGIAWGLLALKSKEARPETPKVGK